MIQFIVLLNVLAALLTPTLRHLKRYQWMCTLTNSGNLSNFCKGHFIIHPKYGLELLVIFSNCPCINIPTELLLGFIFVLV